MKLWPLSRRYAFATSLGPARNSPVGASALGRQGADIWRDLIELVAQGQKRQGSRCSSAKEARSPSSEWLKDDRSFGGKGVPGVTDPVPGMKADQLREACKVCGEIVVV